MTISKKFWLFDTGTGSSIYADDAAELFKQWRQTGVLPAAVYSDWELEVTADNTGMWVKVKPGTINIEGYFFKMSGLISDREVLTIEPADPTNPRIDRVVAYVHPTNNTMDLKVIEGVPASSPSPEPLDQDLGAEWQESLALIDVAANETSIETGHVTDDRSYSYPDFDPDQAVLPGQISPQGAGSGLDADTVDGWHAGAILLADGGEKTIDTGEITIDPDTNKKAHYTIDTESDDPSDLLNTITFTTPVDGYVIALRPIHEDRTVIIGNGGNIITPSAADLYMMGVGDHILLRWDNSATKWYVVGGSYGQAWGISMPMGDGSTTIPTGIQFDLEVPWKGEIHWHRLVSQSAVTIQFDVWKDTYANYPPTVADTIYGTKPALSAATKDELTSLVVAISKGDWLTINCDSNTDCLACTLSLGGIRRVG